MDLTGKTIVVTGGGAGIGRAGALQLSAAGGNLVIADRDDAAGHAVAEEIKSGGRPALPVRCDVTQDEDWTELRARCEEAFGGVDILWNHAGIGLAGPPESIPVNSWQELLDVDVLGYVRGVRTFLPAMQDRGSGHLIFTTSGVALFPEQVAFSPYATPYVVCKSAEVAYARSLRAYLRAKGVGVSLLVPDVTATAHTFETPIVGMTREELVGQFDLGSLQQPEDVALRLVEGLQADEYLISCVPNTRELFMAAADELFDSSEVSQAGTAG